MSAGSLYLRRLAVMLGVAMPATAVLLFALELAEGAGRDAFSVAMGAGGLVYVWGAITGTVASLLHTVLVRRRAGGGAFSVIVGTGFGLIGGGLTPTLFTGILEPVAIGLGGFAGLVYGAIVALELGRSNSVLV